MASEIKADKLSPSGGTALQIGDASDTITIPTGATFTVTDGIGVAGGGTGLTSLTAGDVLYATGTTTLAKLAKGTAEQVLAMNSGATAPDWGSVDLTVLPTITVAKGGTNLESFTAGDILYATGTTTLAKLGKGTGLQGLQTNSGATAPEWAASPQSVLTTGGDILYASGSNTMARLAKGSGSDTLKMNSGATAPEWVTVAAASSDFVKIQTVSVTGTAAEDVDMLDFISTDYINYQIHFQRLQGTGATAYLYPIALDSSDAAITDTAYTKGWYLAGEFNGTSPNGVANDGDDTTGFTMTHDLASNRAGINTSGIIYMMDPGLTIAAGTDSSTHPTAWCQIWGGSTSPNYFWGVDWLVYQGTTTPWNGFKFKMSADDISTGFKATVYGLKS